MGDAVLVEVDVSGKWQPVGTVRRIDPPGSLASEGPAGREVYMFGYAAEDGAPGVWRSVAGADAEVAGGAGRVVAPLGLEQLSDLAEPYALNVMRNDRIQSFRITVISTP